MIRYLLVHPSCLLGPGIWFSQARGARMHRKLVRQAWPGRPRWQWYLLLSANWLLWYLLLGWRSIYQAFEPNEPDRTNWDLTPLRLFTQLLYLVFWIGAPARDFHRFGLNRVDRSSWLDYVYSSEELSWQRVFSCPENAPSAAVLNDKLDFEQRLQRAAIPTTETIQVLDSGTTSADIDDLLNKLPVFLKPRSANAMRGCLLLSAEKDGARLWGKNLDGQPVKETDRHRIHEVITAAVQRQPMLVQRVLCNSELMQGYAGTIKGYAGTIKGYAGSTNGYAGSRELVTLRLITGLQGTQVILAYAILEIPEKSGAGWDLQALNKSGESVLLGPVPQFRQALDRVTRLHQQMTDLKTVAWDLCLTEQGWTVLEGNTGWALVQPQRISGIPLLASGLQDCYEL